jgi:hypothetical protein
MEGVASVVAHAQKETDPVNRPDDENASAEPLSYRVDQARRLVHIKVRKNLEPSLVADFYTRLFAADDYQRHFNFVVDRRGLPAPTAETVRAVVETLRDHADQTGACRMAMVTVEDAPRSAWRNAEMLLQHYTAIEFGVFDDLEAAEQWAAAGA